MPMGNLTRELYTFLCCLIRWFSQYYMLQLAWLWILLFIFSSTSPGAVENLDSTITNTLITHPETVKVGAYVMSVHNISFREREYMIRFWLWFIYKNSEFNFSKFVEVPNAKLLDKIDTLMERDDSLTHIMMKVQCTMKQDWDVGHYPFDKETLNVQIENTNFDSDALVFSPDSSGDLSDTLSTQGWHIEKISNKVDTRIYRTTFGEQIVQTDKQDQNRFSYYSRYNINIAIKREAGGLFAKLFLGMYVSFLIAVISLFIDITEIQPRFEIPVGAMIAVVGNKYIIEPLLPEASNFTLVDILHLVTLVSILLVILVSCITLYKRNKAQSALRWNFWGRLLIVLLYVSINFVLIYKA